VILLCKHVEKGVKIITLCESRDAIPFRGDKFLRFDNTSVAMYKGKKSVKVKNKKKKTKKESEGKEVAKFPDCERF
jgi:hypothetical protein